MMSRADELLAELRLLVDESRDTEIPDFFHAIDNGAWLAGVFDELDKLLTEQGELPQEWQR
jgi:hypothetical protein